VTPKQLETKLQLRFPKQEVTRLAVVLLADKSLFNYFIEIFFRGEGLPKDIAAWVLTHCSDLDPQFVSKYHSQMILHLKTDNNNPTKRAILRALQDATIDPKNYSTLIDLCFGYLLSQKEEVAIKVFAMTVLYNISNDIPDIKNELRIVIEDLVPIGTAGIKSRGGKILSKLEKEL